jgi:CTP:molybdopterin cytidylyltransferase MocA
VSGVPLLVVLAAGQGRRLGQTKALCRLGPRTALEHVLDAGRGWPRAVVLGADAERIEAGLPVELPRIHNPEWARGRTGGLRLAVQRFPGRDFLVAPVDVPLVQAHTHRNMRGAWEAAGAPERGWLAPSYLAPGSGNDPRAGHPVLIGRELLTELANFEPDRPLKELRALARPCWLLAVEDEAILDDLDSPADAERLRQRLVRRSPG